MKRILACIMVCMFIAVSVGCSGKKGASEGSWSGKSLKRAALTFYFPYGESSEMPKVLKELGKRASTELNVSIQFKYLPGDTGTKVRNIIEAGEPCDVFLADGNSYKPYYEMGMIKDISNLFLKYAPEYYKSFEKVQLAPLYRDGKLLGIPANSQPYYLRPGVLIRDDLLERYGSDIKSIDDYGRFLSWVKSNNPSTVPVYFNSFYAPPLANALGYSVLADNYNIVYKKDDKAMKLFSWEQTPEYKKLIDTYLGWYKNGYIGYNASNQGNLGEAEITSGQYASFMTNYTFGMLDNYNNMVKTKGLSLRYKFIDIFPGARYDKMYDTSNFLAFNSKSPNVERTLMFIEWLHQDLDNYKLLTFGIEGTDYNWDEKKGVTFPKDMDPELSYLNWAGLRVFRSYKLDVKLYKTAANQLAAYLKDVDKNSSDPLHAGFTFDRTELNEYTNSLNLPINWGSIEYRIINGNLSASNVKSYIDRVKPASDKFVEKFESLLNEWKMKNK